MTDDRVLATAAALGAGVYFFGYGPVPNLVGTLVADLRAPGNAALVLIYGEAAAPDWKLRETAVALMTVVLVTAAGWLGARLRPAPGPSSDHTRSDPSVMA